MLTHSANNSYDQTYLEAKNRCLQIKELFKKHQIHIPSGCSLDELINSTINLSDNWLTNQDGELKIHDLYNALSLTRISTVLSDFPSFPNLVEHLKKLTQGSLSCLDQGVSNAKDKMWELDLWHKLFEKQMKPTLDEPDIKIEISGGSLGFACKRLNSEKNFSKVLSKGASQIRNSGFPGIIAVNIDALVGKNIVLNSVSEKSAKEAIQNLNLKFLQRNERFFQKYLSSHRIIGAMVSTTMVVITETPAKKINRDSEWTFWSRPDIPKNDLNLIKEFYGKFIQ